jgi:alpha-tubulin N-acetyltransferase 1
VPVTNSLKFFSGQDRLYLLVDSFKILGMLKIGNKKLFIRDEVGNVKEIEPLCVLDFYVHESCQRSGYGKYIFEYMLDNEKAEPNMLGYDRPSSKFINFLKKHFGLENYVKQANNFVVFNSYFLNDKTFKTYIKDPVKPRGKTEPPKVVRNQYDSNQQYGSNQQYNNYQNDNATESLEGKMPSYKEAMQMRNQPHAEPNYQQNAYEPKQNNNSYEPQSYEQPPNGEFTDTQERRVHFSDNQPDVYQPQDNYQEEENYQQEQPNYTYNNYDGYQAPAGRNYMKNNIEKDQFQRKFNRTNGEKWNPKDTVNTVFTHPEADGPLDTQSKREKIPVEYEIKKTDKKISDTEAELMKCQERLDQLNMRSTQLTQTAQNFHKSDNFLGEEKKQIYSTSKDVVKVDPISTAYNKRFNFATVYDNKYKNIAKDPSWLEGERSATLSNAGSKLLAQNPNMNVYQHQQLLRSTPFGAASGDSAYSKMKTSSVYGNFFNKK